MKSLKTLLRITLLSVLFFARTHAQTTVSQVVIYKGTQSVQASGSGAVVDPRAPGPNYGGPYNFRVSVQGTNISALTPAPQIVLAAGSTWPTENPTHHNGGVLFYAAGDDEWKYGNVGGNYGGPSEAGRDASFAFGTYHMNLPGASFDLNFAAPGAYPDNMPMVTMSGGSWVAGRYVIDVTQPLTITTNAFTNFGQNADGAMELQVENTFDLFAFHSDDISAPNFHTYTIPANTLTAGRDYHGSAGFYVLMDKQTSVSGLPGALCAAVYSMDTQFMISAVSAPAPGAQATFYHVGHLNDLSGVGGNYSEIRDATKTGGVIYAVGNSIAYEGSTVSDTGLLWTSTAGLTALPNFVDTQQPNPSFVTASAITPDAAYIAGRVRASTNGTQRHATRTTVSGLVNLDFGVLPAVVSSGGAHSAALAISTDGSVMYGFSRYTLANGKTQAVRLTASGPTMTAIPFLSGDDQNGPALRGTSSDGSVMIGTSTNTSTSTGPDSAGNRAFRYVYPAGTVTAIPFLTGGTWNGALALSADGNLALVSGNSTAHSLGEVYLYNNSGAAATSLGAPNGSSNPSNVGGLNADGSLVVLSWGNSPNQCYLRNGSGWHSLSTIMTNAGVNLTSWSIDSVFGMSADGTLVWGAGQHNGSTEGWVCEFTAGYLAGYGLAHDFNSDGTPDIVWQNSTTGDRGFWLMSGTTVSSWVDLGIVPTDWRIAATGDFNGDGKPDFLWENTVSGDRGLWLMNGTTLSSWLDLGVVQASWHAAAAGDFDGDGKTDIVWENSVSGDRGLWLMNGTAFSSWLDLGVVSTALKIVATGDFNGDGKTDLVWENTSTGKRVIWFMNGTAFVSSYNLGIISTDWHIAAVGDYNADGKSDILWENTVTGERYIWFMNGTAFSSGLSLGVVGTDWRIAP